MEFDDIKAIKQKVSVIPLVKGGANFETHVLIKTDNGYKFKPSTFYAFFCGIFASVPYGALVYAGYKFQQTGNFNFITGNIFPTLIFLIFFLVGNYLLISLFSPIIFDKSNNSFTKGFNISLLNKKQRTIHLNNIVALQIIGEHVRSDDGSYKSFELNLVLNDSKRVNIVDHGKLKSLISDARTLSTFLNVPIWHAGSNEDLIE